MKIRGNLVTLHGLRGFRTPYDCCSPTTAMAIETVLGHRYGISMTRLLCFISDKLDAGGMARPLICVSGMRTWEDLWAENSQSYQIYHFENRQPQIET